MKAGAAAFDLLRPPPRGLVALIYHRVGRRTAVEVDLPVELFAEQIAYLAQECHVVSLEDGLRLVESPEGASEKPDVVVTFDDGTADFVDIAVPVLAQHGVPATLYLATSFVEHVAQFPDDGTPASWAGLRDALSTGFVDVGSHTHRHVLLDRADASVVNEELDRSIGLIADRLGVDAQHFAYPKAVAPSPEAEAAVRTRFRSAALAGTRPNPYGATDPYRLSRSPIQVRDGMRWFIRKARGGMGLEDRVRSVVDRRRYRNAVR